MARALTFRKGSLVTSRSHDLNGLGDDCLEVEAKTKQPFHQHKRGLDKEDVAAAFIGGAAIVGIILSLLYGLPMLFPGQWPILSPALLTPRLVYSSVLLGEGARFWREAGEDPPGGMADTALLEKAMERYTELLDVHDPHNTEALYWRGMVCARLGLHMQAIQDFDRSLSIRPTHHVMFAKVRLLLEMSDSEEEERVNYEEAFRIMEEWFKDSLKHPGLISGNPRSIGNINLPTTTRSRLRHDLQQLEHLEELGLASPQAVQAFRHVLTQLEDPQDHRHTPPPQHTHLKGGSQWKALSEKAVVAEIRADSSTLGERKGKDPRERHEQDRVFLSKSQLAMLQPYINRALHFNPPQHIAGGTLNPSLDFSAIEEEYLSAPRGVKAVFVDNMLTQEALQALLKFCEESTIFNAVKKRGYMCSLMDYGFAAPVLAQLAREMRARLPRVFCGHNLAMLWAYKYDDTVTDGIGIHADMAAVNVNCWPVSDDHRLDRDSAEVGPPGAGGGRGGLVLWPQYAPANWSFQHYNLIGEDQPQDLEVRAFREELVRTENTSALTVPHKTNRCLIFDSSLFHATDKISFARGYRSRRINLTLLFGRMHETCKDVETRKSLWAQYRLEHQTSL